MSNRPTRKDILRQRKTATFVGRERQLELFQTNLDRDPQHPGFHFIFNVFGQGDCFEVLRRLDGSDARECNLLVG